MSPRRRRRRRRSSDGSSPRGDGRTPRVTRVRRRPEPGTSHRRAGVRDRDGFWGDADELPAPETGIRTTEDPHAVPRSLGPPPLPGHEAVAEHYFAAVYDRSINLTTALAAAGGLVDPSELTDDEEA